MTFEEMLLARREVLLLGEINHESAKRIIMKLLYLRSIDAKRPITLMVDSHGGIVDDALAIADVMRDLDLVDTHCVGGAEGGAVVVLAAGRNGHRRADPNSRIRIMRATLGPDPSENRTQMPEESAAQIEQTQTDLAGLLAKLTGRPIELIMGCMAEGACMSAADALNLGLIDCLQAVPPHLVLN